MKENMLDVLLYLLDHYIEEDEGVSADHESLKVELVEAGFPKNEIDKALIWLNDLSDMQSQHTKNEFKTSNTFRVFNKQELKKMGTECCGFLMSLEQGGTLDEMNRELIIDRIMALEANEIDLDQLKWIVMMVLFNQPDQEETLARLENIIFQEINGVLH
jgi:Smg protein